jgi:uncharacterized protein
MWNKEIKPKYCGNLFFLKKNVYFINILLNDFQDMIETSKINEIVGRIAQKFNPDKIILFGSYASENSNADSDLDLIVIKDTDQPKHLRGIEIRRLLIGSMVPMDILVYTQKEFDEEKSERYSFINYAIKNSKILYERNSQ